MSIVADSSMRMGIEPARKRQKHDDRQEDMLPAIKSPHSVEIVSLCMTN